MLNTKMCRNYVPI